MDAASARIYREGVFWRMMLPENRLPLFRIMRLSPCGGTGRRARLKIVFRKEWGFDSLHGHHSVFADVRGRPKVTKKPRLS